MQGKEGGGEIMTKHKNIQMAMQICDESCGEKGQFLSERRCDGQVYEEA